MSKLIEADGVKNSLLTELLMGVDGGTDASYLKTYEVINRIENIVNEWVDNQPTVKAIPIDKPFLKMRYGDYVVYNKKWLVDHLQTEWDILQGKEYQPSIPIEWIEKFMNRFRLGMVTSDEYALLHFMLTEWENENEHKESD